MKSCPGSIGVVQPKPDIFRCPGCGREVEIWSDEAMSDCPVCSKTVFRPGMQSCLDWCKHAKECVGEKKMSQYTSMKKLLRKQALSFAMESYFGTDERRIKHAKRVEEYAIKILADEPDADPNVVLAAALLHDIGIKKAEEKYGSAKAEFQEAEGPEVARSILKDLDYNKEFINEVCDIIGHHHHPRTDETINFKVLYDADQLVNAEESGLKMLKDTTGYLTKSGAKLAAGSEVNGEVKEEHA